jgi:Ricin-type beta-trefoil lectin domain-like
MRFFSRRPRALAVAALAGLALAAVPAAASAQSLQNVSIATAASYNSLVLDVVGGSTDNGAKVVQWYGYGGGNQRWNVVDQGDGTETIVNQNSGKCLTTDGVAGRQLYQFTCVGAASQKWRGTLTSVFNPDANVLINDGTGLVMDVNGASATAGAAIVAWHYNGGRNQYFSYYQLG